VTGTVELHEAARRVYRDSVAAGEPMPAATLADRFQRSARWARDRIAEVRTGSTTEPDPTDLAVVFRAATTDPEPVAETIIEPAPVVSQPMPVPGESVRSLKRVRNGVRLALALGVAASVAGNVLHAAGGIISQIIAAWSPLALLITVELISRVPVHRRSLALVRWLATAVIAGIAGYVSYFHMAAVASRYGETGGAQYLLPISVDGLIVVASVCLVELGGRIRASGTR